MKKQKVLVITIPFEGNAIEEYEFELFRKEALHEDAKFRLEVGRSLSEQEEELMRVYEIMADRATVQILETEKHGEVELRSEVTT